MEKKPAYKEIMNELELMISDMGPNTLIPSERELAEKLGFSRMTIRKAVGKLSEEGKLYRIPNKGTFVADKKLHSDRSALSGFTKEIIKRGMKPSTKVFVFDEIQTDEYLAEKLEIRKGDVAYRVFRLRLADETPMTYECTYMPKKLFPNLTKEICEGSLYQYIENECKYQIAGGSQELEAIIASAEIAGVLKIKEGDPLIYVKLISLLIDGRVFEYSESYQNAKNYRIVLNSKR